MTVPAYGIGAGPHLDAQLPICHDLLGSIVGEIRPKFVKAYADIGARIELAFRAYVAELRAGTFPGPEQCYPLGPTMEERSRASRPARPRQAG